MKETPQTPKAAGQGRKPRTAATTKPKAVAKKAAAPAPTATETAPAVVTDRRLGKRPNVIARRQAIIAHVTANPGTTLVKTAEAVEASPSVVYNDMIQISNSGLWIKGIRPATRSGEWTYVIQTDDAVEETQAS